MLRLPFRTYLQVKYSCAELPWIAWIICIVDHFFSNLLLVCPAEIYHIVSKSSTANDAPTGQEIGESKTIIPAEVWSL